MSHDADRFYRPTRIAGRRKVMENKEGVQENSGKHWSRSLTSNSFVDLRLAVQKPRLLMYHSRPTHRGI